MALAIVAPVAGLPVGVVRHQLSIDGADAGDDSTLELVINAVNDTVIDFRLVDKFIKSIDPEAVDPTWRFRIVQGATMLAARVFARRNSVEGVASFSDQGAIYVQRNDPDVAMLLGLGQHAEPAIG